MVVRLAMTKPVKWFVSSAILAEYAAVLKRPELDIRKGLRQQFLQALKSHTRRITPSQLPFVTVDPTDTIFIECADAARADYLVTGNTRDFPRFWKMSKIITSREFLTVVAPHLIP
jgi:putative PIN family toxin of toxin-antitoxin system